MICKIFSVIFLLALVLGGPTVMAMIGSDITFIKALAMTCAVWLGAGVMGVGIYFAMGCLLEEL